MTPDDAKSGFQQIFGSVSQYLFVPFRLAVTLRCVCGHHIQQTPEFNIDAEVAADLL